MKEREGKRKAGTFFHVKCKEMEEGLAFVSDGVAEISFLASLQTHCRTLKPCTENILADSLVLQRRSDTNGGGDNEIDEQRRVSVSGPHHKNHSGTEGRDSLVVKRG